MNRTSSLFSQILALFQRSNFARHARELKADFRAKGFSSWDQFVAMLFCQLGQARSLREISDGLRSCEGKLKHLGLISNQPRRSTLSYANAHRPWQLYQRLFYDLLAQCQAISPKKNFRFKNRLLTLDSSLVELCASMYDWAHFSRTKGAIKIHCLLDHDGYLPVFAHVSDGQGSDRAVARSLPLPKGSVVVVDRGYSDHQLFARWTQQGVFFVTRLRCNAVYARVQSRPVPKGGALLWDDLVQCDSPKGCEPMPVWRRIGLWCEERQEQIEILTNHLDWAAATICAIYKSRWQIELFFKALKQQLKIKTFVGTSANAVFIQIWTALIAILVVRYLQFRSKFRWAVSNLVALLRLNLFTYRDLWEWLNRPFDTPPEPLAQLEFHLDSICAPR
jgi:Domain of unknown function (DUF4372)/Transposase DDE domain